MLFTSFSFPSKNVYYYLAFPFDPLNSNSCGFDKHRFFNYSIDFKKFFDNDEVLLADEFWNFVSGENETMPTILKIINSISKPDFMTSYNFLNDPKNSISDFNKYSELLNEWNLNREFIMIKKKKNGKSSYEKNNILMRLLNQNLFNTKGEYKEDRINSLLEIIKN